MEHLTLEIGENSISQLAIYIKSLKVTNKIGPEAWIQGTDLQISEGRGMRKLEEISQRTYMHVCRAHGPRQQRSQDWGWSWVRRGKGEKMGDICNSVKNLKINEK